MGALSAPPHQDHAQIVIANRNWVIMDLPVSKKVDLKMKKKIICQVSVEE